MNKKEKTLSIIMILLLISAIFVENPCIKVLSIVSFFMIIVGMRLTDFFAKDKLIKEIKNKNMTYIKVGEKKKGPVLSSLFLGFTIVLQFKLRFDMYKIQEGDDIILSYINSLEYYQQSIIISCVVAFVITILDVVYALFSSSIITDDKVIFYDGIFFQINEIDEIKHEKSLFLKNKKVIKIGKGVTDRKIIVDIEDFQKVNSLLGLNERL